MDQFKRATPEGFLTVFPAPPAQLLIRQLVIPVAPFIAATCLDEALGVTAGIATQDVGLDVVQVALVGRVAKRAVLALDTIQTSAGAQPVRW